MPPGGCEVQAEQLSDPPAYPVRFKPLLERPPEELWLGLLCLVVAPIHTQSLTIDFHAENALPEDSTE